MRKRIAWVCAGGALVLAFLFLTGGVINPGISLRTLMYLATGTGAKARSAQSKLGDTVSVKDFGAVGDGVTDDTAAIQNALNTSAGLTVFPDGNYKTNSLITLPAGERIAMGAGTWTHAGIRFADSATGTVEGSAIDGLGIGKTTLKLADSLNIDAITSSTSFDRLKRKEFAIGGAVRSSNVVTITTAIAHNFQVGDVVYVENAAAASTAFNGRFTVASTPLTTTFTYAQTGVNESNTVAGFVGNAYGAMRIRLEHLTIDCNRTNNVTSGDCVKLYSRGIIIQNVEIKEARGKGLWTESSTVTDFTTTGNELEGSFRSIKIHGTSDVGLLMKGPHDSNFADIIVYSSASDCAQFWRPFRFNNMNFFICNGYGMRLTSLAAVMGTNIQSEAVIIDSTVGGAAPAPNVMEGVLLYGNGSGRAALELQGYDNTVTGYIKNDVDSGPCLKFNAGAGQFKLDVGTSLGYWVDYGSAGRSESVISMWGAIAPVGGYETGTKQATDVVWMWNGAAGGVQKNKGGNLAVPGTLSIRDPDSTNGRVQIAEGNSTLAGYVAWHNGTAGTRLGYCGNNQTDLECTLENSAKFKITGPFQINDTKSGGTITLSAGTGTATTYSGARCVCTDTTANASVRCAVATTTLTATGTGTDVIAYMCF